MFRFCLAPPLLFNPLQFLFSTNTRFLKPLALPFSPTTRLCFLPQSGLLCCQPTTLLLLSSQSRFFRSLASCLLLRQFAGFCLLNALAVPFCRLTQGFDFRAKLLLAFRAPT
jgi:hypothetical protein